MTLDTTSFIYLNSLSTLISLLILPHSSLKPEKFFSIVSSVSFLKPIGVSIKRWLSLGVCFDSATRLAALLGSISLSRYSFLICDLTLISFGDRRTYGPLSPCTGDPRNLTVRSSNYHQLEVRPTDLPIRHSHLMRHPPGQIRRHPKFATNPPGKSVNRRYPVRRRQHHTSTFP
ncbi:hypothetical protein E2C01_083317 [Portunus trituberculatus]|uniref:Uncharacterized protein n=1 Tax=Portunus trituberculatus TaxID=210409 RepID=A0A5B7J0W2_PORTR|nr:hypothetical protein [Portunus trituberculatus]